ncbi:LPXTG cell wall anchor domain-containing protein [Luteimonas aquatica]|uniref:LPXTG cell wall anchor domain-containing protein n=1 Tax=Luteimonas aquatica TaxID=450364 RepID=UPI001F59DE12|nr:LPXTG cell wall anchor domain-containing protein [Luteimonas aquatica]
MTEILALLAGLALAALAAVLWRRRRDGARRQALGRLLDAADGLEARLRAARAEIEAAGSDGEPVRQAMRDMLRHRLWLQQHGTRASLAQLGSVRDSIDLARQRIEGQLLRIERARLSLQ